MLSKFTQNFPVLMIELYLHHFWSCNFYLNISNSLCTLSLPLMLSSFWHWWWYHERILACSVVLFITHIFLHFILSYYYYLLYESLFLNFSGFGETKTRIWKTIPATEKHFIPYNSICTIYAIWPSEGNQDDSLNTHISAPNRKMGTRKVRYSEIL